MALSTETIENEFNNPDNGLLMALSTETIENEFNRLFGTHFYVNPNKEVVIKNIQSRLILSEVEQAEIIKEIHNLTIKKSMGEEPSRLEQIALRLMFEDTY